jgi:hypothetical protein
VARTQRKKLELRGPAVSPELMAHVMARAVLPRRGTHDGRTKMPSDLAFPVERVTRIELA